MSRELDRKVAEQVFKHEVIVDRVEHGGDGAPKWIDVDGVWHDLPHYSERIADAWLVFVWLVEKCGSVRVEADMEEWGPEKPVTVRWRDNDGMWQSVRWRPFPEAICRAALAAVEA